MTEEDRKQQQAIHDALIAALPLDDGHVLTGWVVLWETTTFESDSGESGSYYGPRGMTTWRSLGLIEWARRFCLKPDGDEDGD